MAAASEPWGDGHEPPIGAVDAAAPHLMTPRSSIARVWRTLRMAITAAPTLVVAMIVVVVVIGLAPAVVAWATKALVDEVAAEVTRSSIIILAALIVGIVSTINSALQPLSGFLGDELRRAIGLKVELGIAQQVNSLEGIRPYEDPEFFDTVQLAQQGASSAGPQVASALADTVRAISITVGFVIATAAVDSTLLIVLALGAIPTIVVEPLIARQRVSLAVDLSPVDRRRMFFHRLMLMPVAARELRVYGLASYFSKRMESEYLQINTMERRQGLKELRFQFLALTLGGLAFVGATLLVSRQAVNGEIGPGDVALILLAIAGVQSGITSFVTGLTAIDEASMLFAHYERLNELTDDIEHRTSTVPGPYALVNELTFEKVSFRYGDAMPWVLKDLTMTIPARTVTGLVGLNGAGKSTLIKLLLRLYDPTHGRILWDGTDIRDFDVTKLREGFAVVLQDLMEYDLTAHENIGLGRVDDLGDRDAVVRAARFAGIAERIDGLPGGYDTLLSPMFGGQAGIPALSGGEWQRLSIARGARRFPAELTVLDEPSAFLDATAESELFEKLGREVEGKTAILISHRFTTLNAASTIRVLQDGRLLEAGGHESLMAADGTYAEMYRTQLDLMMRAEGHDA